MEKNLNSVHGNMTLNCNIFTTLQKMGPFYSFTLLEGVVYYSHWTNRAVYAHDPETKNEVLLVGDLFRPTRIVLRQNVTGIMIGSFKLGQPSLDH